MSSIASCVREIDPLSLALSLGVRERDVIFSMFLEPELIVAHLTNVPGFSIDIVKRRIKVKKILVGYFCVYNISFFFYFYSFPIPSDYPHRNVAAMHTAPYPARFLWASFPYFSKTIILYFDIFLYSRF